MKSYVAGMAGQSPVSFEVLRRRPSGPKTWTGPRTFRKSWSPRATRKSASTRTRTRVDLAEVLHLDEHERLRPELLHDDDLGRRALARGRQALGPDADGELPRADLRELLGHRRVHGHLGRSEDHAGAVVGRGQQVHGRRADEAGHEEVGRVAVQRVRLRDLLHDAVVEDGHALAHRHGLHLVVRHVHGGDAQARLQVRQLRAGLDPELGVQVGERLIHEEDLRVPHDGAAHGHALALAAGELLGLAVKVLDEVEDARPPP